MRSGESAWRGVELLVRRLETDGRLSIELFDVRRDELEADLISVGLGRWSARRGRMRMWSASADDEDDEDDEDENPETSSWGRGAAVRWGFAPGLAVGFNG